MSTLILIAFREDVAIDEHENGSITIHGCFPHLSSHRSDTRHTIRHSSFGNRNNRRTGNRPHPSIRWHDWLVYLVLSATTIRTAWLPSLYVANRRKEIRHRNADRT